MNAHSFGDIGIIHAESMKRAHFLNVFGRQFCARRYHRPVFPPIERISSVGIPPKIFGAVIKGVAVNVAHAPESAGVWYERHRDKPMNGNGSASGHRVRKLNGRVSVRVQIGPKCAGERSNIFALTNSGCSRHALNSAYVAK